MDWKHDKFLHDKRKWYINIEFTVCWFTDERDVFKARKRNNMKTITLNTQQSLNIFMSFNYNQKKTSNVLLHIDKWDFFSLFFFPFLSYKPCHYSVIVVQSGVDGVRVSCAHRFCFVLLAPILNFCIRHCDGGFW